MKKANISESIIHVIVLTLSYYVWTEVLGGALEPFAIVVLVCVNFIIKSDIFILYLFLYFHICIILYLHFIYFIFTFLYLYQYCLQFGLDVHRKSFQTFVSEIKTTDD